MLGSLTLRATVPVKRPLLTSGLKRKHNHWQSFHVGTVGQALAQVPESSAHPAFPAHVAHELGKE